MIKHTYLNNLTLNVPVSIHKTGKLHLDEDGCITEELSFEQEKELIDHPDFVTVESETILPKLGTGESAESKTEGQGEIKPDPEFKEGDTKIVGGKGFIYKKNKAEVLTWLRHPEIDEKG